MPVLNLNSVKDTSLWIRLSDGFAGIDGEIAKPLAENLIGVCREAHDRMRGFPSLHPEYTLHDQVHLLRVTELMSLVMPTSVADKLNPAEIALLILAAHFHDQGMVLEDAEIRSLRSGDDQAFNLYRKNWEIEHPNFKEATHRLQGRRLIGRELDRCLETIRDLDAALLTDYVRSTHGARSRAFVRTKYDADPRWTVQDANLAELASRLCASHVRPASDLIAAKGFRCDEVVGIYRINMPYLALVLRLADILDFDRDRTPDSLYRSIDFRSMVSLKEWEKHRSVEGWVIEPTRIQFTMRCEHPEYQRAAYQFMDWIDREIADAHFLVQSFPAPVAHYRFGLPLAVDRSRIEPKDDAYIYRDLEFSLSRNEIIKLLMTEKLYVGPWLCIRELLQNALDALRHRQALFRRDHGIEWPNGKVEMGHDVDKDGHEVVWCRDNGAGMDKDIVVRFLTRAGRSYYRSPEFEQERGGFRAAGADFDPCAQFGIGFMSCFMLGDRITIQTRRDKGPSLGQGEPLQIEINGIGGIVVIRKGADDLPCGTTVRITGRRKPTFLDSWEDRACLVDVLNGYALACEFPIEGRTTIPEIADSSTIPPGHAVIWSRMGSAGLKNYAVIEQDFSEIDGSLGGSLRGEFLINEGGGLAIQNTEASWRPDPSNGNRSMELFAADGSKVRWSAREEGQVCIDGILVAGEPGSDRHAGNRLGSIANPVALGRHAFLLDIRGNLKPPLTPQRTPLYNYDYSQGPGWNKIQMLVLKAGGRLWEKLLGRYGEVTPPGTLWQLACIYGAHDPLLAWMCADFIWKALSVPVIANNGECDWMATSSLGALDATVVPEEKGRRETFALWLADGRKIDWHGDMNKLALPLEFDALWDLNQTIVCMSTIGLKDDRPYLELRRPLDPKTIPGQYVLKDWRAVLIAIPYSSELREYLSVHMACRNINRHHGLAHLALEERYQDDPTEIQRFASSVVWCSAGAWVLEHIGTAEKPVPRLLKKIGCNFKEVEWSSVAPECCPPYKIRSESGETIELTREVFDRWAEAEVAEDS